MALVCYPAVNNVPLLRGQGADELLVVRNHDHAALELADGDGQTAKTVAVQEVSRFVEHEEMGVVPHGASDDDLDFLTAGQRTNLVMVSDLRVETKILKVLADDGRLQLAVT